ncbi:hypothetical protein L5515_019435 [Caenorhabditis briggsae]|uniref:Uncharacterized protein n=1 Tax=Caenorhabditis briggsae TaxID=6238 RepID=A0AAE9JTR4_CAEBR|nr:hypothetical protein L5515_019435 [Caenorhabditis briggsae]
MSSSDAVKNLKVPRILVQKSVLCYQKLRLQDEFPKSCRPFTVTTSPVVKAGRESVRQNPEKSTRKMANDINTCHRLMETILNQKLYSSNMEDGVTDEEKPAAPEEKITTSPRRHASHFQAIFALFDEEKFAVEADENGKNGRIIATDFETLCKNKNFRI